MIKSQIPIYGSGVLKYNLRFTKAGIHRLFMELHDLLIFSRPLALNNLTFMVSVIYK